MTESRQASTSRHWEIVTMCRCGDKEDDHWMVATDCQYTNRKKRLVWMATDCSGELRWSDARVLCDAKNAQGS